MKISKYLTKDQIRLDLNLKGKSDVLQYIADFCAQCGLVSQTHGLLEKLVQREATMSTGIGDGIGLPHAAADDVVRPAVLILRPEAPVPFEALDGAPVTIFLALIVPENQRTIHIRMLAAVSRLCKDSRFLESILSASDPTKLYDDIIEIEDQMAFH